jgi:ABC-type transport system involved in cytochrome c biogenesis permease subunit
MNWTDWLSLLTLLLYVLASVAAIAGLLARHNIIKRLAFGLTLAGFGLHSLLLLIRLASPEWHIGSRSAFLLPLAWCLVAVGLVIWWKLRHNIVLLFSPPLAFLLLFVSLVLHGQSTALPQTLSGPIFSLHLVSVFIGIGAMAVAAGAALVFLYQEKFIKSKIALSGFRKDLPALAVLDKMNSLATWIGFPFYTLGMLCGFTWARMLWGKILSGDPKELLSLLIWLIYAALFNQRQALGWRGRKPAIMALLIFSASLFSMFAVNMLLPTHHSFTPHL